MICIFDYYTNKSLPLFGWLKPCMICCDLTSLVLIFYIKKKYKSFVCKNCNEKYSDLRIKLPTNKLLQNSFISKTKVTLKIKIKF